MKTLKHSERIPESLELTKANRIPFSCMDGSKYIHKDVMLPCCCWMTWIE